MVYRVFFIISQLLSPVKIGYVFERTYTPSSQHNVGIWGKRGAVFERPFYSHAGRTRLNAKNVA